jgi:Domain of unknown function (DUF4189)
MIWPRHVVVPQGIGEAAMRRALLTAAAIIAFAAVVSAAPPAFAGYGAIAWDKETGKYGWSKDQATAQKAAELAIAGCGASGCKAVIRMTKPTLCGALATTSDGKHAGGAARQTDADARLAALANCQKSNSGECVIRISECSK